MCLSYNKRCHSKDPQIKSEKSFTLLQTSIFLSRSKFACPFIDVNFVHLLSDRNVFILMKYRVWWFYQKILFTLFGDYLRKRCFNLLQTVQMIENNLSKTTFSLKPKFVSLNPDPPLRKLVNKMTFQANKSIEPRQPDNNIISVRTTKKWTKVSFLGSRRQHACRCRPMCTLHRYKVASILDFLSGNKPMWKTRRGC